MSDTEVDVNETLLKDYNFILEALSVDLCPPTKEKIENRGGNIRTQFRDTYKNLIVLVSAKNSNVDKKFKARLKNNEQKVKVVSIQWLDDSISKDATQDFEEYFWKDTTESTQKQNEQSSAASSTYLQFSGPPASVTPQQNDPPPAIQLVASMANQITNMNNMVTFLVNNQDTNNNNSDTGDKNIANKEQMQEVRFI